MAPVSSTLPTAKQLDILRLLDRGCCTSGAISALLASSKPEPTPWGKRAGAWRAVGATLARMEGLGWVSYTLSDYGQKEWSLTSTGRSVFSAATTAPH